MGRPGKPRCLVPSNLMVVRERSALSHGSTEAHGNGSRRQEVPVAVLHHEIRGTRLVDTSRLFAGSPVWNKGIAMYEEDSLKSGAFERDPQESSTTDEELSRAGSPGSRGGGSTTPDYGEKRLPQALIIGVKKGGTRALLEAIRAHPDVRAVGTEPHFFDRNYEKGLEWYRCLVAAVFLCKRPSQCTVPSALLEVTMNMDASVQGARMAERLMQLGRSGYPMSIWRDLGLAWLPPASAVPQERVLVLFPSPGNVMPKTLDGQITMEKTPSYFVTNEAPRRIHSMARDTKLIVVVRNPVTRAISDYTQTLSKKPEIPTFEVLAFKNRTLGLIDASWSAIRIGIYALHLENWLQYFPLSQILFVSGERLITDPAGEMAKVQDFLGLKRIVTEKHFYFNKTKGFPCLKKPEDSSAPRCLGKSKGRTHPQIDPDVIHRLRKFYKPFNVMFYQMTGQDFQWEQEESDK
ncbi:hypothetical protein Q9233_004783 [Columba guinea]|nr:hypothetical protein Q9233_004783 [Columba guinea]